MRADRRGGNVGGPGGEGVKVEDESPSGVEEESDYPHTQEVHEDSS